MVTSKNPSEQNLDKNAPEGMKLSDADMKAARQEGAKEDVKEIAKDSHRSLTDGQLPGEPSDQFKWHGHEETGQWAFLLDLGVEDFTKRVDVKNDKEDSIPDNKVYGLLALERNGQNRTEYVKAMMKRLKLKAEDLPGGGPDYTNDVTPVTKL